MDVRPARSSRQLWLGVTVASFAVLAAVTWRMPQTLYSDPSLQLRALQQYMAGESPSLNHLTFPDHTDLSKDMTEWYSWWPPGPQIAAYPFLRAGMSLGRAVRWVVLLGLLVGCLGWILWFCLFELPSPVRLTLALLLPWMHYGSNNIYSFSAETFAFAVAPWIFWGAEMLLRLARRDRRPLPLWFAAVVYGAAIGGVYGLKYSIVFASLGVLIYLGPRLPKWVFAVVLVGFLIPVISLNTLNHVVSHDMNPVILTAGFRWKWVSLPWVVALPALALTDGYGLLDYIFLHPTHGLFRQEYLICLLGLPGWGMLLWLLFRRKAMMGPARLATTALLTSMGAMLVVWNFSGVGNYNARYLAIFSMAVLPAALQQGVDLWRSRPRRLVQWSLVLAGLFYVLIPLLYGVVSVGAKVCRLPADYHYGPSHLYNGALAERNLQEVRTFLLSDYHPATDIWYLSDPLMALDIPGRAIIFFADFTDIRDLRKNRYRTLAPKRARVIMPPRFEDNGKGAVIRASFRRAGPWSRRPIPGSSYDLWEAPMAASPQTVEAGL